MSDARTPDDYLSLVTSQHRDKPKFSETVKASVAPLCALQSTLAGFLRDFDLDHAIGKQEDTIGEWVGISRYLDVPLEGVYFSWDTVTSEGWDFGTWRGPFDPLSGLTSLPDDEYRILLRAKIVANSWDGTISEAYKVWKTVFSDSTILIQDNQDMTMAIGVVGESISTITKALLTGGYIPLKPEGVGVVYYAVVDDGTPMFMWDAGSDEVNGWDIGSWASILLPT